MQIQSYATLYLSFPLESDAVEVQPWEVSLSTNKFIFPLALLPLVLLHVVGNFILFASIAEEQGVKHVQYRRVRVRVIGHLCHHPVLHVTHETCQSGTEASRVLKLHFCEPT